MSAFQFTVAFVGSAKCPTGRDEISFYDSKQRGLGLRVYASGEAAYFYLAKVNGRQIKKKIGDRKRWTLPYARQMVARFNLGLSQGKLPNEVLREIFGQKVEVVDKSDEATTFQVAWLRYVEENKSRWSERHLSDHRLMIDDAKEAGRSRRGQVAPPLNFFRNVRLSELTQSLLTEWLHAEAMEKRPMRTALAFRQLRAFIFWALEQDSYSAQIQKAVIGLKAVRRLVPRATAKEGDCLQREALKYYFTEILRANQISSTYLQTILLTGARPNEIARLKWDDLDTKIRQANIRDKVNGERPIPIPPYLAMLLDMLPRESEYVFSSQTSASGHFTTARRVHMTALKNANLPYVTIYGLRRSFGALSEWVNVPDGVVMQIMGRKPLSVKEKRYCGRPIDMLRKYHDEIEAWILNEADVKHVGELKKGGMSLGNRSSLELELVPL